MAINDWLGVPLVAFGFDGSVMEAIKDEDSPLLEKHIPFGLCNILFNVVNDSTNDTLAEWLRRCPATPYTKRKVEAVGSPS